MRTTLDRNSSAEICRQNGWGPRTLLECEFRESDAYGFEILRRQRIIITAVGERVVVARLVAVDGVELGLCDEQIRDLHAHDWEAV